MRPVRVEQGVMRAWSKGKDEGDVRIKVMWG